MNSEELFYKNLMEMCAFAKRIKASKKKSIEQKNIKESLLDLEKRMELCAIGNRKEKETKNDFSLSKKIGIQDDEMVIHEENSEIKWELGPQSITMDEPHNGTRLDISALKKMRSNEVYVSLLYEKRKQTPSEVVKSIESSDHFEDRRIYLRKEVSTYRRNNQLKAANLKRELVMDEGSLGASKRDRTFDLTSLDEALPPVSYRSGKAPGMKRRALKLQDIVMINMKENRAHRLAATRSLTVDANCADAK